MRRAVFTVVYFCLFAFTGYCWPILDREGMEGLCTLFLAVIAFHLLFGMGEGNGLVWWLGSVLCLCAAPGFFIAAQGNILPGEMGLVGFLICGAAGSQLVWYSGRERKFQHSRK